MRWLKLLISAVIAVGLFYLCNFGQNIGRVHLPPMGKFFSPFSGFWQNGTQSDEIVDKLDVPGLKDEVTVIWDDRRVPHIFARNAHDLYIAQGYITARDRLWQMEFQTHFAAGRLSEMMGERALSVDLFRRRIGMVYAAENSLSMIENDEQAKETILAYTAGVNAYIRELDDLTKPLEYKILDYAPEEWTPLKCALLLKYMSWDLTGRNSERAMTRTREALGDELMKKLYPNYPPFQDPIVPAGTKWDFTPKTIEKPASPFTPGTAAAWLDYPQPGQWNGSNNWAVSGAKTANGHAILSNDPHLLLRLPSIWYEMQLSMPGLNVYGVTLPGSPAVIIGFNNSIAWGVTNAGSDVLDWYEIKFKDNSHKEYWHDGQWKQTVARIEEIKVRGSETVLDTVYYTHHGPVVDLQNSVSENSSTVPGAAMRWVAHDPSNELRAFLQLNRAGNYEEYVEALSYYDSPAQNFAYADISGNIAIWHNGKFPLRWAGQGKYVSDGTNPGYDWQSWLPHAHNPHVRNPGRGFVSSANQNPADESYPYYLGWNYANFTRGARINERLAALEAITPQDMLDLQNDCLSLRARTILPTLISHLKEQNLTEEESKILNVLKTWNYESKAMQAAPLIFENWWSNLFRLIWQDEMSRENGRLKWPRSDVTFDLILNQPENTFFDITTTADQKETLSDLVFRAFRQTKEELEKTFGSMGKSWAWGKARGTDINHLARIPGLGRVDLLTNGDRGIVNATGKNHGPSWRMVVELDPAGVQAWAIYPGGQSGNPGSYYYDNMVDDWVAGRAYKLAFLQSADEKHENIIGKTILGGGK
jgi:penicillin amidase